MLEGGKRSAGTLCLVRQTRHLHQQVPQQMNLVFLPAGRQCLVVSGSAPTNKPRRQQKPPQGYSRQAVACAVVELWWHLLVACFGLVPWVRL